MMISGKSGHSFKRVSQMRAPLESHREPAGVANMLPNGLYDFKHQT